MKKLILLLPLACVAFAQCDSAIVDDANVLNSAHVQTAVLALQGAGADVRVLSVEHVVANLDRMKAAKQASCLSWQSADGGMKNNLVVLMVAVKDRKVGLYYGSQWNPVLDSQWNRIESEKMKPRFRDGDFTGGIVAALDSIQQLIEASNHPVSSGGPVIVQASPTDYTGMSRVVGLIVSAGVLCLLILLGAAFLVDRKKRRDAVSMARQKAIIAQQEVVALIGRLTSDFAAFAILALEPSRVTTVRSLIDSAASQYSALKQSSTADPDQDGLTAGQYSSIAESYEKILADLRQAQKLMGNQDASGSRSKPRRSAPSGPAVETAPIQQKNNPHGASEYETSSTTIFAPVIISEPERYEPPYRAPDPEPAPTSGGGGSWGSSNSDSGGSSDWGSSSSDSGSSSDFGSSDSGGGGSSDF
jgi:uncharacterized membrane protein YgcG